MLWSGSGSADYTGWTRLRERRRGLGLNLNTWNNEGVLKESVNVKVGCELSLGSRGSTIDFSGRSIKKGFVGGSATVWFTVYSVGSVVCMYCLVRPKHNWRLLKLQRMGQFTINRSLNVPWAFNFLSVPKDSLPKVSEPWTRVHRATRMSCSSCEHGCGVQSFLWCVSHGCGC